MAAPRDVALLDNERFIWIREAEVALLDLIKEYRHLWDPQAQLYKKQTLRKQAFQKVAETLKGMW